MSSYKGCLIIYMDERTDGRIGSSCVNTVHINRLHGLACWKIARNQLHFSAIMMMLDIALLHQSLACLCVRAYVRA